MASKLTFLFLSPNSPASSLRNTPNSLQALPRTITRRGQGSCACIFLWLLASRISSAHVTVKVCQVLPGSGNAARVLGIKGLDLMAGSGSGEDKDTVRVQPWAFYGGHLLWTLLLEVS